MPDTEVSTDMAETMSPIEQTYRFYTQHFSEKEIQPLVETVLGMIVQLDKDEQKDESTRKQILDEMRGALDAVSHLCCINTENA